MKFRLLINTKMLKNKDLLSITQLLFLYPTALKSVGFYVTPSIQKFGLSVFQSVPLLFVSALYFEHFLPELCIRVDIWKEWFGIVDG